MPREILDLNEKNIVDIVLINPSSVLESELHYGRRKHPRLGIAYLSSFLKKEGIKVKCIDGKYEGLSHEEIIKKVLFYSPICVGLTAMTPELMSAISLAEKIKMILPNIKIIIGGPHVTALPKDSLMEYSVIDYVVVGEGELTLTELIRSINNNNNNFQINGIAFRDKGNVIVNNTRQYCNDIDSFPLPDWGEFPKGRAFYPIITTRGCPFKCIFCMRASGDRARKRTPSNIINEIKFMVSHYNIKRLAFSDETFGLDKKWAHNLLDLMVENKFYKKVYFTATTRVDVVDIELLKKMKKAGFSFVAFGVESGNADILKMSKKGITLQQVERSISLSKKANLDVGTYFILGFPYESIESMLDTINFASKLPSDFATCGIMVPYPGTEISKMVKEGVGGYVPINTSWNNFNKQSGSTVSFEMISNKEISKLQFKFYLKYYIYKFSLNKILVLIKLHGLFQIISVVFRIIKKKYL